MALDALFESAVHELDKGNVLYAVAGAMAAILYRRESRLTMDIDLAVSAAEESEQTAIDLVESLGLHAGIVREADLAGGPMFAIRRRSTPPCMIVGRPPGNPQGEGVDVLLPVIPWVEDAIQRAQSNRVDFGFGSVPVLTLEDCILSKLYALKAAQLRAKDLDDLQSVFEAEHDVDVPYLAGAMTRLGIVVPRPAEHFLPDWLLKISREIHRAGKRAHSP